MAEPIHYCTYFDHRYLARALCLYDSLVEHSPPFTWHVLALSETCADLLTQLDLPFVKVVRLSELESALPELQKAKSNRSVVEYYFTLTSAFCHHLIDQVPSHHWLTYLDSDLYFFRSPEPIFLELEESSVGIIEHHFSLPNEQMEKYGRFNVGWVSFRNDEHGLACLKDWYTRSLDWCYDRVEGDRFADQKYLDAWPQQFARVRIIEHRGANLGPWNVSDFGLVPNVDRDQSPIGTDAAPLLFAHFQMVRFLGYRIYETGFDAYSVDNDQRSEIAQQIYMPYVRHLHSRHLQIRALVGSKSGQTEVLRGARSLLQNISIGSLLRFPGQYRSMARRYNWVRV